MRAMLTDILVKLEYEVVGEAENGVRAIQLYKEVQPDIVFMDISMPEMNGYQLAEALRQLPAYQTVPLVAITGYSMFDDQQRSKKAGFNAHMTKPIDPRALIDLIEHL